jgi:ABC-type enterochelin transport system substrate-binding protein
MARTLQKFEKTIQEVKDYHKRHNKSVWFVPLNNDYKISTIAPSNTDLPLNTIAILYDVDMNAIDKVVAYIP